MRVQLGKDENTIIKECILIMEVGTQTRRVSLQCMRYTLNADIKTEPLAELNIHYEVTDGDGKKRKTKTRKVSFPQNMKMFLDCRGLSEDAVEGVVNNANARLRIIKSLTSWDEQEVARCLSQSLSCERDIPENTLELGLLKSNLSLWSFLEYFKNASYPPEVIILLSQRAATIPQLEELHQYRNLHILFLCASHKSSSSRIPMNKEECMTMLKIPIDYGEGFFSFEGIPEHHFGELSVRYPLLIPVLLIMSSCELSRYQLKELRVSEVMIPILCSVSKVMKSTTDADVITSLTEGYFITEGKGHEKSKTQLLELVAILINSEHVNVDVMIELLVGYFNFSKDVPNQLKVLFDRSTVLKQKLEKIHNCWKQHSIDVANLMPPIESLIQSLEENSLEPWAIDVKFIVSLVSQSRSLFLNAAQTNRVLYKYIPHVLIMSLKSPETRSNGMSMITAVSIYEKFIKNHTNVVTQNKESKSVPTEDGLYLTDEILLTITNLIGELTNILIKRIEKVINRESRDIPNLFELQLEEELYDKLEQPYDWDAFNKEVAAWHAIRKNIENKRILYNSFLKVVKLPKKIASRISDHLVTSHKVITSQPSFKELKKTDSEFWEYISWWDILKGMPLLDTMSLEKRNQLFPFLQSEGDVNSSAVRVRSILLEIKRLFLSGAPDNIIIQKDNVKWIEKDVLELVTTVLGGNNDNIPVLLKHAENLSCIGAIRDWMHISHGFSFFPYQEPCDLPVMGLQALIDGFTAAGFDRRNANKYTTKRMLKPVIDLLRSMFPDRRNFINFVPVALDHTTHDPKLQHIIRELSKAHQYRVSESLADLPEVSSKLVENLPAIKVLVADLKNDGGRDMRKLSIVSNSRVFIKTEVDSELSLAINDVLYLTGRFPDNDFEMSFTEWEEFMTTVNFGFTNLEGGHLENRKLANSLFKAAKSAATTFINTRKSGTWNIYDYKEYSVDTTAELRNLEEEWKIELQTWNKSLLVRQKRNPVLANVPMAVLRSKDNYWSPLLSTAEECPGAYGAPRASSHTRPGAFHVRLEGTSCPYATIVQGYVSLTKVLPSRWSMLLGHRTTTEEDVNLFIRRINLFPKVVYACTNISHLTYSLQKLLMKTVEDVATDVCLLFADVIEPKNDFFEILNIKNTTLPTVNACCIVGDAGCGKTRFIKKSLGDRPRRVVTVNGDKVEYAFVGMQCTRKQNLVIRIGDAVINKSDVDRLLFQIIILKSLVDGESKAHTFNQPITIEIQRSTELLNLFNKEVVDLKTWNRDNVSFRDVSKSQKNDLMRRLGTMPMTQWATLSAFYRTNGSRAAEPNIIKRITKVNNTQTYPFLNLDNSIIDEYRNRSTPIGYESFTWTRELADLMVQLDTWYTARIPIILEGETGCGKTYLVKCWCALRNLSLEVITIHGGYDMFRIKEMLLKVIEKAHNRYRSTKDKTKRKKTLIFLDEMNTTSAVDLLKEAICDFRVDGKSLATNGLFENVTFIGAINPDRKRTNKELERYRHQGLQVLSGNSTNLADKVYRVHSLPETLKQYCIKFPDMDQEIMCQSIEEAIESENIVNYYFVDLVKVAHSYIKYSDDSDYRFVSFRDVARVISVYKLFMGSLCAELGMTSDSASMVAIHVVYVSKLNNRSGLYSKLGDTFESTVLQVQNRFMECIKLPKGIVLNDALRDNVFMMIVGITLKIPVFIIGPPGTSKSLSKSIVSEVMIGIASQNSLFRKLPEATLRVLQCSPHTTAKDLSDHFDDCSRNKNDVVVLEEAGLAEMSPEMPLKLLHEKFDEEERPCILTSNWNIDPAKMNRGLFLTRSMPSDEVLLETAKLFAGSSHQVLEKFLTGLSIGFKEAAEFMRGMKEFPEGAFYALRDFYNCVKMIVSLPDPVPHCIRTIVHKNFSGLPRTPQLAVDKIFESKMGIPIRAFNFTLSQTEISSSFQDIDNGRFPLIVSSNISSTLSYLKPELEKLLPDGFEVVSGSGFSRDSDLEYTKKLISRIRPILNSGRGLVLLNANTSYESLYDLFNKHFTEFDGQQLVDIGLGRTKIKVSVHKNFKLLLLANRWDAYHAFPPPLLNRFQKHCFFVADDGSTALKNWVIEEGKVRGHCHGLGKLDDELICTDPPADEQLAMLLSVCGSADEAKKSLRHCFGVPLDVSHTSLDMVLSLGGPMHVTVDQSEYLFQSKDRDIVLIDVGAVKTKEELEFELSSAENRDPKLIIVCLFDDSLHLFSTVDMAVREILSKEKTVLVTNSSVMRSFDGYYSHHHVTTAVKHVWKGLDDYLFNIDKTNLWKSVLSNHTVESDDQVVNNIIKYKPEWCISLCEGVLSDSWFSECILSGTLESQTIDKVIINYLQNEMIKHVKDHLVMELPKTRYALKTMPMFLDFPWLKEGDVDLHLVKEGDTNINDFFPFADVLAVLINKLIPDPGTQPFESLLEIAKFLLGGCVAYYGMAERYFVTRDRDTAGVVNKLSKHYQYGTDAEKIITQLIAGHIISKTMPPGVTVNHYPKEVTPESLWNVFDDVTKLVLLDEEHQLSHVQKLNDESESGTESESESGTESGSESIQKVTKGKEIDPNEVLKDIQQSFVTDGKNSEHMKQMLHRSIELIATDAAASKFHFVFELLQNFDDAEYSSEVIPTVVVVTNRTEHSEFAVFGSNEVGFTETDVRSICNVGSSTKKGRQGFIGEKGIGFKSVFAATNNASISSNGYNFKFEKDNSDLGMICPLVCDSKEIEFLSDLRKRNEMKTCIVLKGSVPVNAIVKIDERSLLFFRNIKKIKIDSTTWHRIEQEDNEIVLRNEVTKDNKRFHIINKVINDVEVTIAFPYSPSVVISYPVFSYLPIRKVGFNFILNADFKLTLNRCDIHNNESNKIIKEAFNTIFEQLLVDSSLNFAAVAYLPVEAIDDEFFGDSVNQLLQKVSTMKCIKTTDGEMSIPSKVVFIETKHNSDWILKFKSTDQVCFTHPDIARQLSDSIIRTLNIKRWSLEQLLDLISSNSFWYCNNSDSDFFIKMIQEMLNSNKERRRSFTLYQLWPREGDFSKLYASSFLSISDIRKDVFNKLTDELKDFLIQEVGLTNNISGQSTTPQGLIDAAASCIPSESLAFYISCVEMKCNKKILKQIGLRVQLKSIAGKYESATSLYDFKFKNILTNSSVVCDDYDQSEKQYFEDLGVAYSLRITPMGCLADENILESENTVDFLKFINSNYAGDLEYIFHKRWWSILPDSIQNTKIETELGLYSLRDIYFIKRSKGSKRTLPHEISSYLPIVDINIVGCEALAIQLNMNVIDEVDICDGDGDLFSLLAQQPRLRKHINNLHVPLVGGGKAAPDDELYVCDIEDASPEDIFENFGIQVAAISSDVVPSLLKRSKCKGISHVIELKLKFKLHQPHYTSPLEAAYLLTRCSERCDGEVKTLGDLSGYIAPPGELKIGFHCGPTIGFPGRLSEYSKIYIFDRLMEYALPYADFGEHRVVEASEFIAYLPSDKIFCVGDGDFSFSNSLRKHLKSDNITACDIKSDGCDATDSSIYTSDYDYIVFNFPHTGVRQTGTLEDAVLSIESNEDLLEGFFSTVPKTSFTRIHVTLKTTPPYCYWDLIGIAKDCGWKCVRSFPFPESFYRSIGYKHTTTKKLRIEVNVKNALTYEFVW